MRLKDQKEKSLGLRKQLSHEEWEQDWSYRQDSQSADDKSTPKIEEEVVPGANNLDPFANIVVQEE